MIERPKGKFSWGGAFLFTLFTTFAVVGVVKERGDLLNVALFYFGVVALVLNGFMGLCMFVPTVQDEVWKKGGHPMTRVITFLTRVVMGSLMFQCASEGRWVWASILFAALIVAVFANMIYAEGLSRAGARANKAAEGLGPSALEQALGRTDRESKGWQNP